MILRHDHFASRCTPSRGQSGVSLVEVLVGIAVMIPLTIAAVTGLMLTVTTSSANEVRQELEVRLSTATEDLKALPYLDCGSAEEYQELYSTWSAPLETSLMPSEQPSTPVIESVQYWNRGKDAYTGSCGGDDGAQQLTVTLVDQGVIVSGSVVKRDADARVGNSG